LLAEVLLARLSGTERKFTIINDCNGYDEISLTTEAKVLQASGEREISPSDFGQMPIAPDSIALPSSLAETLVVSKRFLSGLGDPKHEAVVAANAALAMQIRYPEISLKSLCEKAIEAIRSGKGMQILNTLRSMA
jgi:anthranilate phosphoribosyltransferase